MNERNNNKRIKINPDEVLFGLPSHPARARTRRRQANFTRNNTPEFRQPKPFETQTPRKKKKSFSIVKIFLMTILLVCLLAAGAVSAGVAWYVVKLSEDLPSMVELANPKSSLPSILYDRNGEVIARLFIENRTPVGLHEVSTWLVQSVLAAEDSAFYQHGGIRIGSIMRALWTDIVEKGKVQGASTITQQLARNLFLSHEKSITRKAKEIIIAA